MHEHNPSGIYKCVSYSVFLYNIHIGWKRTDATICCQVLFATNSVASDKQKKTNKLFIICAFLWLVSNVNHILCTLKGRRVVMRFQVQRIL